MSSLTVSQRFWNYFIFPRDDGVDYRDAVEQLTHLMFLKVVDERSRPPHNQPSPIPAACSWPSLLARDVDALADSSRHRLKELNRQSDTSTVILAGAAAV